MTQKGSQIFVLTDFPVFRFHRTELSELCERQAGEIRLMQSDIDKVNQNLVEKEEELFSNNHRQECLMSEV